MRSSRPSQRDTPIRDAALFAFAGLMLGGYPTAWILFSPKSVLRSTVPEFVNGFGAGVGFTLGSSFGLALVALALLRLVKGLDRKRSPAGR